jgi:hypothetical protein
MRSQTLKLGSERRAFFSVLAGVALIAVILGLYLKPSRDKFTAQHAAGLSYRERLKLVPEDAVLISGSQSIAVTYWRGIGMGRWDVIGAGSGWPAGQLAAFVAGHLLDNRRVVIDADPRFWSPCGWQAVETRELAGLATGFRFRRLSDNLYEVRPVTDETARDEAKLESLLPENRSPEVQQCKGQGKLS